MNRAWLFGILSVPCPVVTLSCKPDGGLTHVCLPFLELGRNRFGSVVEDMIESLGVLVWMVARIVYPAKVDARSVKLVRTPHKAEWKDDKDGLLWFNKACESGRIATTIVDTSRQKGARKRWYAYLGGGAVDKDQTAFLKGVVVLAKDWEWAACTLVASWLLSCCSECGTPVWVDKRLLTCESAEEPNEDMSGRARRRAPTSVSRSCVSRSCISFTRP